MSNQPDPKKFGYIRAQSEFGHDASDSWDTLRPKSCGPGRKQLPPLPDNETVLSSTHRTMERLTNNPCGDLGYGPFFLEYSLMAEYQMLQKQKLPGIYVMPSAKSPLRWNGVMFIRQGIYEGAVLRFSLDIPNNFPDGECPKVLFTPPIYHPVIHPLTGQLDITRAFHKWKRNFHHLWQVLMYARRVFMKIETNTPLNPEAAVLYEQDNESFKIKVAQSIEKAQELLYNDPDPEDDHAIRFSKWDPAIHEDAKNRMLSQNDSSSREGSPNIQSLGLSWMKPGSTEIFTKNGTDSA